MFSLEALFGMEEEIFANDFAFAGGEIFKSDCDFINLLTGDIFKFDLEFMDSLLDDFLKLSLEALF